MSFERKLDSALDRLKEAGYTTVAVGAIHETRSGAERCGYEMHVNQARAAEGTTAVIEELKRLAAGKRPFAWLRFLHFPFVQKCPPQEQGDDRCKRGLVTGSPQEWRSFLGSAHPDEIQGSGKGG